MSRLPVAQFNERYRGRYKIERTGEFTLNLYEAFPGDSFQYVDGWRVARSIPRDLAQCGEAVPASIVEKANRRRVLVEQIDGEDPLVYEATTAVELEQASFAILKERFAEQVYGFRSKTREKPDYTEDDIDDLPESLQEIAQEKLDNWASGYHGDDEGVFEDDEAIIAGKGLGSAFDFVTGTGHVDDSPVTVVYVTVPPLIQYESAEDPAEAFANSVEPAGFAADQ